MSKLKYRSIGDMPTKSMAEWSLPESMPGSCFQVTHFRYGIQGAKPMVYLQASLHADEISGMLVLHHLMHLLDTADTAQRISGEIIIIPAANPIGLSQWAHGQLQGRFDSLSGTNFNRNLPELGPKVALEIGTRLTDDPLQNREFIRESALRQLKKQNPDTPVEQLKQHLLEEALESDFVLDLHCDDTALMHLYTTPACWPVLADLAGHLRAELVLLESVSGGHPFDEACSRPWSDLVSQFPSHQILQGCHSATIELRGGRDVDHTLASADAANLFRFLQRRKAISGNPGPAPKLLRPALPLSGMEQIRAPEPGIAVYLKQPGDFVEVGETVVELIHPNAEEPRRAVTKVQTKTTGLVFARCSAHMVSGGQILTRVAGEKALPKHQGPMLSP